MTNLAALRIHARHHVLDRPVFAGRIHRLEDEQHRPAILRVEHVLAIPRAPPRRFAAPPLRGFVFGREFAGIAGIYIFKAEFLPGS